MRIYEDYDELTRAVLMVGYAFDLESLAEGGDSLDALMELVPGLEVEACCDLENTEEDELEMSPLLYGVKVLVSHGGSEQERGFTWEQLSTRIAEARAQVEAAQDAIAPFFAGNLPEIGTHLGCCGWLANAWFVKGEWDEGIDHEARRAFGGTFGDREAVYLYQGTDGATQDPYPNGGVRGIMLVSESFDGNACTSIELDAERDGKLDETLGAAGILAPRYFVIGKYD